MNEQTMEIRPGVLVVPEGAPREQWMQERGEGVTASQAWEIARGGISTWRRILEQKLNGSTFRGNAATRAGSEREAALLDEATEHPGFRAVTPNRALWASAINPLHRATPDGIGGRIVGNGLGLATTVVEVKSHEYGWEGTGVPSDHFAQMQWQMYVMGGLYGLYGSEVRDEDDQPPADGATWIEVPRDEEMIAWLIERANAFIAWRDAGCPAFDELPEEIAAANEAWALAKVAADEAAKAEKKANVDLRKALASQPYVDRFGAVGMGEHGGYQLLVSEHTSLDEDAWREAEPDAYAEAQELRTALAFREAEAKRKYTKTSRRQTLRFQEAGK